MSDAKDVDRAHTPEQAAASWKREVVELAVLFVAVGLAHLFATLMGHSAPGPAVLITLGAGLIMFTFVHKRLAHRRPGRKRLGREGHKRWGTERQAAEVIDIEGGRPMKLWRIRTRVVDRPGRLAELATAFARLDCNVLALHIAATGSSAISPSGCDALDEFVVEAPTQLSEEDLRSAVEKAGGLDIVIVRAYVKDLVDPGVQALVLAHAVSDDPEQLPHAMAELLRAPDVQWRRPGDTLADSGESGTTLVISVHPERALLVSRPALPFTPTEAARAAALAASVRQRRYSD
ncbi:MULTISPECIES: ACT domain-containing protein [unclassified Nonomuraea]|uniref:ACT domain-containing protein n=1 Tax=unclassified Nonomuraea TaxID=2593643 RepID=UPI00340FA6A5